MDFILLLGAILVTWLVFTALIKIVKTTVGTALKIAILLLILQLFFAVDPQQLWETIINLPQKIQEILKSN